MKTTQEKIVEIIKSRPGAFPVGFVARTEAKLSKGHGFGNVEKVVRAVGWVGADYGASVSRQSGAEFTPAPLPWGEWVVPNKLISHKGKLYLRTQTASGNRRRQPARVLSYRGGDGRFLSRDEVKPFLPAPIESKRQSGVGLSGAENQIWVRTYCLDSIQKIRVGGRTYSL